MTDQTATAGQRLVVAVCAFGLALLVAEGALSLANGRSLAELVGRAPAEPAPLGRWNASRDADRIQAAAQNPGYYRLHDDPRVGFVMKAEAALDIAGAVAHTDAHGMRRRVAGPPPAEALRLVVLGDSVAFGFGVADDQTLAQQLEDQLAAARPATARPLAGVTVAVPGWNHLNAVHYLLDHLDRLDPDLVVYLPINNDLSDSYGVYESGHRQFLQHGFLPGAADPWLPVNTDRILSTTLGLVRSARRAGRASGDPTAALGPFALSADLSPESRRRYDDNVASIGLLAEVLARRETPLVLAPAGADTYFTHLLSRLAGQLPELPVVPLFARIEARFSLGHDPHPNPTTLGVVATWIAHDLLASGLLEGDPAALPPVPALYADARVTARDAAAWQREADAAREAAEAQLVDTIAPGTARGLQQVYGGLNADGSLGWRCLAVLPRASGRLEVTLEPLPGRADTLPQQLTVRVDGALLASGTLTEGPLTLALELPPGDGPVEVGLALERAVAIDVDGRTTMASCRLVGLSTAP